MSDTGEVYSVSIIDSHPLYRDALARVVSEQPDMRVVQVVSNLAAFEEPPESDGGVVIVDCHGDTGRDVGMVQAVSDAGHRVLVLSAADQPADVLAALDAGADGYIGKDAEADQLLWAMRRVAGGEFYLAPRLSAALVADRKRARTGVLRPTLTEREREVLVGLAGGLTDQEIAKGLSIKVSTVRSHLDHVRDKTGLRRRAELALYAVDSGLYGIPENPNGGGAGHGPERFRVHQ